MPFGLNNLKKIFNPTIFYNFKEANYFVLCQITCTLWPLFQTLFGINLGTSQYRSFSLFVGQTCKFVVNTCNAGAGALAVTVEGPSKVKLECKEVDEGYEFTYSPTAPGDYMITIRYAGVNIAGSPFKAKIEGIYLQHYIIFFGGIIVVLSIFIGSVFMDLMKICGQESYQYHALLEIAR